MDDSGHTKVRTFLEAGIKPGSPEFWEQVQLGKVFAYLAGKKDPVQIQVDNGSSILRCSQPLTAENASIPAKPLSGWLRDTRERHADYMFSIYRPDPEFREEYPFLKDEAKGQTYGLYTKQQFDSLVKYPKTEIDVENIPLGKSGKKLSHDEYSAITMFALWDDDLAINSRGVIKGTASTAIDIHAVEGLKGAGIPEQDAKKILDR